MATVQQLSETLSLREEQCVRYLLEGMSNKQIAWQLQLSTRTIEFYLDNVKSKLSCKNKTQLIVKLARFL